MQKKEERKRAINAESKRRHDETAVATWMRKRKKIWTEQKMGKKVAKGIG